MNVKRLFDILDRIRELFPDNIAFASKVNKQWKTITTREYVDSANYFSYGLLKLGVKKGDKIITISNNRYEWNFLDMGILQVGAVHVPVYPTISEDEYKHIFSHTDAIMLFVSDKLLYEKVKPIATTTKGIQKVYTFDEINGANHWSEIIQLGKANKTTYEAKLAEIKSTILPNDIASIIYTSGTTGLSKGVMLSHNNFLSNFLGALHVLHFKAGDKSLSFLPLCHVFERTVDYACQYLGMSIYYAENLGTIGDNLKEINPKFFITVPRILEKFYDKIISRGKDLSFLKKTIFFWAVRLGLKYKQKHSWWYKCRLHIARKLVFNKWKEALGGSVELIISGGAALQERLSRLFWAAEIPLVQGYGLTETAPIVSVNYLTEPGNNKFGTVGSPLPNVKVKIASDSEILIKGPNVMLGYYKNNVLTKEVIDNNGWFHTGDIGLFEDGKFLRITDRKKEIFKNSAGKYIAPQLIENKFRESDFIEQIMVIGENEKFTSALISPNFDLLHSWAYEHHIHFRDNRELIEHEKVFQLYQKEVNLFNKSLGQIEKINRFRLVCEQWTLATGELSATLKLRRKVILEKYLHIIEEIYSYR